MLQALVSLALASLLAQGAPAVPLGDLAVVKALYSAASYEDALTHLSRIDPAATTAELEQYRALCLLALGRAEEGDQAFERLVRLAPLYVIPESDVSPRVLARFREVRRRVLPAAVRDLYATAKTSFDAKQFETAVAQFGDLMSLLADADLSAEAAALADVKQLGDGFRRLAELEVASARAAAEAAARAASAPPVPAVTTPSPANQLVVTRIVVYSRDDAGVTPPVEVERFMPPWSPPPVMARSAEYRGTLEVIVDETGGVQDARMIRPTVPAYDLTLIGATRRWRFEPARRNGEAVKYRLAFEIVLAPRR
jgi:TonB family protein